MLENTPISPNASQKYTKGEPDIAVPEKRIPRRSTENFWSARTESIPLVGFGVSWQPCKASCAATR